MAYSLFDVGNVDHTTGRTSGYRCILMTSTPEGQWLYKTLKKTLASLTCENVVVLTIPAKHDLLNESLVSKEISKSNFGI
jgi:hypothetical protein